MPKRKKGGGGGVRNSASGYGQAVSDFCKRYGAVTKTSKGKILSVLLTSRLAVSHVMRCRENTYGCNPLRNMTNEILLWNQFSFIYVGLLSLFDRQKREKEEKEDNFFVSEVNRKTLGVEIVLFVPVDFSIQSVSQSSQSTPN